MQIREMTEEECRDALARESFGRLAMARDGQPYVVPIYYAYDGHHVYGFSIAGQKIDWMRSNPLVCLEIDERTSPTHWMSVVVSGRYEELLDTPEFAAARAHAHQALQEHAVWWGYTTVAGAEWRRKTGPFTPIFYRLHVDNLTGHRAVPASS